MLASSRLCNRMEGRKDEKKIGRKQARKEGIKEEKKIGRKEKRKKRR